MKVLIPPSEGKSDYTDNSKLKILFESSTKKMIQKVKENKIKFKESDYELNINALKNQNTAPAMKRYSGVVYKNIDYESLSKKSKLWFDKHILIFSGLFGFVSPKENIPNYKLKFELIGAAKFWQPILTKELKNEFIVDLLASSQRKAYDYKAHENRIEINFYHTSKGKKVHAGHFGKVIKGRFIQWLAEQNVEAKSPEEFVKKIKKFNIDNYEWRDDGFYKEV